MADHKTPKCPLCGGDPCTYRIPVEATMDFHLSQGKFDKTPDKKHEMDINHVGFSHPTEKDVNISWELSELDMQSKILAVCEDCDHEWKLRKFRDIDDLINIHGYGS